ncbi:response regulator transcription factor [Turicimonas muris]|uniref:response regulator transcription factor n=2 Tax=Turicimonas muris TaxID=1796652 RepID=UPI0023F4DBBF|nr:response regulator [Turicimonas muris]
MTVILEPTERRILQNPLENPEILIRIVDDNTATCKSLEFFLEALGYQVKIWNDPEQFLKEYKEDKEDGCLLLDIRMPKISGIELHDILIKEKFRLPIIFLTGHGDVEMAVDSVKKGAFNFLLKPSNEKKLTETIEAAVQFSLETHLKENKKIIFQEVFDSLTPREKEVVRLVARGKLNKIIASDLNISEKTVQQHRSVACHKLAVRSVPELVDFLKVIDN